MGVLCLCCTLTNLIEMGWILKRWVSYVIFDKYGETIDFLLTEKRDKKAALRYLKRDGCPT